MEGAALGLISASAFANMTNAKLDSDVSKAVSDLAARLD